jgi:hypothetical protein
MSLQVRVYLRTRLADGSRLYLDPGLYRQQKAPTPVRPARRETPEVRHRELLPAFSRRWQAPLGVRRFERKTAATKKLQREQILAALDSGLTVLAPARQGNGKRDRQPQKNAKSALKPSPRSTPTSAILQSINGQDLRRLPQCTRRFPPVLLKTTAQAD